MQWCEKCGTTSMPQQQAQLKAYSKRCIQPGIDYFHTQLRTSLHDSLVVIKAARRFSPHQCEVMQPVATSLTLYPFLNQGDILTGLEDELPAYIAKYSNVSLDMLAEERWKRNLYNVHKWSKQVLLLQLSSQQSLND